MFEIHKIRNNEKKTLYTRNILGLLPEWFELEEGIQAYIQEAETSEYYISQSGGKVTGFISVKIQSSSLAEIMSMGVLKEHQGMGIGRSLIEEANKFVKELGVKQLQVKTLGPSAKCEYYEKTRDFYKSVGFYELEENHKIWGRENPCLIMVKPINK